MPRRSSKHVRSRTLRAGLGPGACNKYRDVAATPCCVTMFQPKTIAGCKDGRDVFSGTQNPYQLDKTYLRRVQMAADRASEAFDEKIVARGRERLCGRPASARSLSASSFDGYYTSPEVYYCAAKGIDKDTVGNLDTSMPGYMGYHPGVGPLGIHPVTSSKASLEFMTRMNHKYVLSSQLLSVASFVHIMSLPETDAAAILASALLEPDIGAAILAALQGPRDHRAASSLSSTSVLSPSNRGEEGRHRASKALTEIDTVVMKNLAGDVTKAEIVDTLTRVRLPLPPIGIEFHLDARGAFRGTVFVKFPTQRSAAACVEAFQPPNNPCRIGLDLEIRVELQRKGRRERACTARDVMEASLSREKQDTVKKLVDDFLADDRQ
ncbi:hypothetical protein FOZ63_024190, partial [Perkinsus olseni]